MIARTEKQLAALRAANEHARTVERCQRDHAYPPGTIGRITPQRRCLVCRAAAARAYRLRVKARQMHKVHAP